MMKKLLSVIFVLSSIIVLAQREASNWYFGDHAGIKFNLDGSVTAVTNGEIDTAEGCSSVSDCDGNLLFYTDGVKVWNKNHSVMQNGTGLLGDYSSTQSALIVKEPGSMTRYYIFTVGAWGENGLYYSIVDMSLNGGMGAVISVKNVTLGVLSCSTTEKVAVVKHANGIDFWVISLSSIFSEANAFLLTSNGINNTPVVSPNVVSDVIGYMKASPDGSKIAICRSTMYQVRTPGDLKLYDFDKATGVITNPVFLYQNDEWKSYGVEFSPNGKVLYVSLFYYVGGDNRGKIVQYDLLANDIPSSAIAIVDEKRGGALQLGINNKIYFSIDQRFLGVINNPNTIGLNCGVDSKNVFLEGKRVFEGLPNFPQAYFAREINADGFCLGSATHFTLNSDTSGVVWDFGDGTTSTELEPYHQYAQVGVYTVTLSGLPFGCTGREVMTVEIFDTPAIAAPIANQQVCGVADMVYDLSQFNATVLGSQQTSLFGVSYFESLSDLTMDVNSFTFYNLPLGVKTFYYKIYNLRSPDCYSQGSFDVTLYQEPDFNMNDEYFLCENSSLVIAAPPGFYSYLWSTGATTSSIVVTQTGNYSVTVTNNNGFVCGKTENFIVTNSNVATITGFTISDWTQNANSFTVLVTGLGDYEYSLDGINYQSSNVFSGLEAGEYAVFVRDKRGCGIVEGSVFLLVYPNFFTPNGDGFNENWQIKFSESEPEMKISIFDRYGKLISKFTGADVGWDGNFNGKPVVSEDYWFVVERENGKEFKGHFALKR